MKIFCHVPLQSSRSFRLVRLLPSADFDSEIEVELFEASLDDHPPYEALSYTWGARHGTQPIVCNGFRFLVTPNCESAMRHLRKDRLLWIDSICIDQSNDGLVERDVQVPLMGEIYSKAVSTLCWLGPGLEYTSAVMRLIDQIGECPSQRGVSKLLRLEESLNLQGSCLDHIYCAPWHTRIWTVQEVAFASNCQVLMGHSSVSWEHYSSAGKDLLYESDVPGSDVATANSIVSVDVRDLLREQLAGKEVCKATLTSCLTEMNQFKATDPRDKIYGLYAMYAKLGVPFAPVDYSKSVVEVYTNAASALMEWSGSLNMLQDACSIRRDSDLPSWVPDWNDGEMRIPMSPHWKATMGSSSHAALDGHGRLRARGIVIGEVAHLHLSFPIDKKAIQLESQGDEGDTLRSLIEQIEFFRGLRQYLSDDELFHDILSLDQALEREELWELWLEVMAYPECEQDLNDGRAIAEAWKAADETETWSVELLQCATIAASLLQRSLRNVDPTTQESLLDIIKEVQGYLSRRTVATVQLSDREVLGVVFCKSQTGDQIVLLEGLGWPAVLRSKDKVWTFVGAAFVMGVMNGEAWPGNGAMSDFLLV
ncbi:hypothetical protein AMS68_003847 [Peltaster fructicola]|uniref:Heterokaryon incompatibility domain-containing protein n=1 Tax=Peltaster fructicola TaxID=286661 RepID=A0A6H0XV57_9PEZI|nr:hypothetical protein AMS68_003847 [Peltaster fructicola]